MPASAKLVGHYFPDFSLIDTVMSVNPFTMGSRRTLLNSGKETSSPYKRRTGNSQESGEELKDTSRPWTKVRDVETANVGDTRTVIATAAANKGQSHTGDADGIHLQQEWRQTWQPV